MHDWDSAARQLAGEAWSQAEANRKAIEEIREHIRSEAQTKYDGLHLGEAIVDCEWQVDLNPDDGTNGDEGG